MSADRCQSCGKAWTDHLGIAGTCAENKRLRKALHEIMMAERLKSDGSTNHIRENVLRRRMATEALR